MSKTCGNCGSVTSFCVECGAQYPLGTVSRCTKMACQHVNAPVSCSCGFDVCGDLSGVVDYDMKLIPFKGESD